jgi:hypothetical protein
LIDSLEVNPCFLAPYTLDACKRVLVEVLRSDYDGSLRRWTINTKNATRPMTNPTFSRHKHVSPQCGNGTCLFKKNIQLVNLHEIIWSNALKTNKTTDRFCNKNILAELQFFEKIFNWSSIAVNVHEINRFYVCYEFAEI